MLQTVETLLISFSASYMSLSAVLELVDNLLEFAGLI